MTPDWSVIGSCELNCRILSSISPTVLCVSINICNWASLRLSRVKVHGRARVPMGQESCRWKKENVRNDQRDSLAKPSFNEEPEAQGGSRLAFSFSATWWHIRSQDLFHVSRHTWMSDMWCMWYYSAASLDHGGVFSIIHQTLIRWIHPIWWHYWPSMRNITLPTSHRLCIPT